MSNTSHLLRQYIDILENIDMRLQEKWATKTTVSPEERGKYSGKSLGELRSAYNSLKASGPHKKGSKEYGRMRELAFAIRAKTGWGKVADEEE